MLIDEKAMLPYPPPPYAAVGPAFPPPFPAGPSKNRPTLAALPPPVLLKIVYELFPPREILGQRRVLYWMNAHLRRTCRSLYVACMHVLRSTYLPAYASLIKPPYTTDPFPSLNNDGTDPTSSPVQAVYREVRVLDRFHALKAREDVWTDESSLHMERDELFRDIFDVAQPRARLEDLVRKYGVREGVVTLPRAAQAQSQQALTAAGRSVRRLHEGVHPIRFELLSVTFSPRKAGLVIAARDGKRTIVEVQRSRDESLESSAALLVREFKIVGLPKEFWEE